MSCYLAWLVVCLLQVCQAQISRTVSLGLGRLTGTKNGVELWKSVAVAEYTPGICSPMNVLDVSWLCSRKAVNQSDIVSAGGNPALIPQSSAFVVRPTSYAKVTSNVYLATLTGALPYVSYVLIDNNSSSTWVCDAVLPFPYYGGIIRNNTFFCRAGPLCALGVTHDVSMC